MPWWQGRGVNCCEWNVSGSWARSSSRCRRPRRCLCWAVIQLGGAELATIVEIELRHIVDTRPLGSWATNEDRWHEGAMDQNFIFLAGSTASALSMRRCWLSVHSWAQRLRCWRTSSSSHNSCWGAATTHHDVRFGLNNIRVISYILFLLVPCKQVGQDSNTVLKYNALVHGINQCQARQKTLKSLQRRHQKASSRALLTFTVTNMPIFFLSCSYPFALLASRRYLCLHVCRQHKTVSNHDLLSNDWKILLCLRPEGHVWLKQPKEGHLSVAKSVYVTSHLMHYLKFGAPLLFGNMKNNTIKAHFVLFMHDSILNLGNPEVKSLFAKSNLQRTEGRIQLWCRLPCAVWIIWQFSVVSSSVERD